MSYRDALKVFKLERALNDDETAFLNTLRGMTDAERELTVEALSPQTKKPTKKAATKSASKSRRATSISTAIQGTAGAAGRSTGACSFSMDGGECSAPANDPIHDPTFGYAGYHPFVESSPAPGAAQGSSSKNGEGARSGASSETQPDSASNVVHAGG